MPPVARRDAVPHPAWRRRPIFQRLWSAFEVAIIPALERPAGDAELVQGALGGQVRLLDDPDDLELLGCRRPHSSSAPSPTRQVNALHSPMGRDHAFLSNRFSSVRRAVRVAPRWIETGFTASDTDASSRRKEVSGRNNRRGRESRLQTPPSRRRRTPRDTAPSPASAGGRPQGRTPDARRNMRGAIHRLATVIGALIRYRHTPHKVMTE